MPVRASVRDLLTDLLGRGVKVVDADAPQALDEGLPALAAIYVRDDGSPVTVCVIDLALASRAGAALGMSEPGEADGAIAARKLEGDLDEFFREVVNVLAKLLNSPTTPHVKLAEVRSVPGALPAAAAAVVLEPAARVDYAVAVDGYGAGTLTLLAV